MFMDTANHGPPKERTNVGTIDLSRVALEIARWNLDMEKYIIAFLVRKEHTKLLQAVFKSKPHER
jgi:hypothetical protein